MSKLYPVVQWANGTNIYEVNIRQYTKEGTFQAFSEHLPRLKEMGVEVLWLMPVTPISREKRLGTLGSYYACSSYTEINTEFGSLDDFRQLVQQAHGLGMKLMIDWVANHTGYDHHWTKEHPDWYRKDNQGQFVELNGWNDVIDLDYSNRALHTGMISCMQYWVTECDIDGFRCDMAHLVPLDFWKEARKQCDALKPLFWMAECDVPAYLDVFDTTYAWNWMHITEKFRQQQASLEDVRQVLAAYSRDTAGGGAKLYFTSNHDENSWNGTEYEKYGDAAKALAVFTCTWPGIPLVYSGQEIPNTRRLPFFEKDSIQWTQQPLLQGFYRSLFAARRHNTALQPGAALFELNTAAGDKIQAYLLVKGNDKALVVLNLSGSDRLKIQLSHPQLPAAYYSIFSGLELALGTQASFELQAWEYVVYSTVKV
jgi:glycosidase